VSELAVGLEARPSPHLAPGLSRAALDRAWSAAWPKVVAVALVAGVWQAVVWAGWWPDYVLPGPMAVFRTLGDDVGRADFWLGVSVTMRRALTGYLIAVTLGGIAGIAIARVRILRKAIGSAILGLQSMPSIAWFPLAILLFQPSEAAILFVVILGAAPAVAGGLLSGVDHVQPLLVRVGRVMGARGLALYRHVILPAALPSFVGGLKQGWAFAWRSLMAGELLSVVAHQPSLGQQLQFAREFADAQQLLALMIVIFAIGVTVDSVFSAADRAVRKRWGLST
jgi:sulfonate transport system permease protein